MENYVWEVQVLLWDFLAGGWIGDDSRFMVVGIWLMKWYCRDLKLGGGHEL